MPVIRTALAALAALAILAGCGGSSSTTTITQSQPASTSATTTSASTPTTSTGTTSSTSSGGDLTPTFRSAFVAGCARTANNKADCGCIYDKLVARGYTTQAKFADLSAKISSASSPADYPKEFIQTVKDCRK